MANMQKIFNEKYNKIQPVQNNIKQYKIISNLSKRKNISQISLVEHFFSLESSALATEK